VVRYEVHSKDPIVVQEILHARDELLQQLKDNLIKAKNYMKQQADKRGQMQLEVGDLAYK